MIHVPQKKIAENAKKGLDLRKEYGRGGTRIGLIRANQLVRRENLSFRTIKRMKSFFARHKNNLDLPQAKDKNHPGYPSNALIAHYLWGGDEGERFAKKIVDKLKEIDQIRSYHLKNMDFVNLLS